MPRQLEQTPRSCCNKAFGGFPRASGSDSFCLMQAHSTGLPTSPRERCCTAASKVFLRAKKLWVNPPKAERAKPSLSLDYNLLFKNKIGESSLDIHRMRPRHQKSVGSAGKKKRRSPTGLSIRIPRS